MARSSSPHRPMSLSTAFVNHLDVPFDIWEGLLNDVFESTVFKEWQKEEHSWQLRIVGPPGCGKTTVSAMAERLLRACYAKENIQIVCILFQEPVQSRTDEVLVALFRDVLSQLTSGTNTPSDSERCDSLEELRAAIRHRISYLKHAFLIVDDIDLCNGPLLATLEKELADLQAPNLSIMVTSRVPHIYNAEGARCDTHDGFGDEFVYWRCRRCEIQIVLQEGQGHKVVCQACKDEGKVCPDCGENDSFYEPYSHILYPLNCFAGIPHFVARELETAHGDLGLESGIENKPPLSALGRALENTRPLLAERLKDDIANRSDYNVSLAKARLNFSFNARTIEDIERVGDRLPDPIIALFEAVVGRINHESFQDRELGLHALLGAAIRFDGCPFSELETWLQSIGLLETSLPDDSDYNLLRTLHATCGLLTVDYEGQRWISLYSDLLTMFIKQNYSSTLYNLRHRVDVTVAREGVPVPREAQP